MKIAILALALTACANPPTTFSPPPVSEPEHWEPEPTPGDISTPTPGCKYRYSKKYKMHIYNCIRKEKEDENG